MIKSLFKKLWDKLNNCEFKKECKYFDKESVICLNGGDRYCGQYRKFLKKQINKNGKIK